MIKTTVLHFILEAPWKCTILCFLLSNYYIILSLFWEFNWCKESFRFLIRLTPARGPWITMVEQFSSQGLRWLGWSNYGLTMFNHGRYMENQKSIKNFPLFLSTWKNKQCISLCFPHNSFSYTRQLKLLTQSQRIYNLLQIKQGTPQ